MIKNCRICKGKLTKIGSLGNLAISDFTERPSGGTKCPLELVYCTKCTLLQLAHDAPLDKLYKSYWYESGLNSVITADLKEIAKQAIKMAKPKRYNIFLDIGSNDSTLLKYVPKRYVRVGCEPSETFTKQLKENTDMYINDYWSYENYEKMFSQFNVKTTNPDKANSNGSEWPVNHYSNLHKWLEYHYGKANYCDNCKNEVIPEGKKWWFEWSNKTGIYDKDVNNYWQLCKKCHRKFDGVKRTKKLRKAKIITAIACIYDLEDPNKFMSDIKKVLADSGIFIAQLMTLQPMIDNNDVGNVCHEHRQYYSYKSLVTLYEQNGLEIYKVEKNKMNGGSYRLFARHFKKGSVKFKEKTYGVRELKAFMTRVEENKKKFLDFQLNHRAQIVGYGASTKANTILQYYYKDWHFNDMVMVVDVNPKKIGKCMIGGPLIVNTIPPTCKYLWVFPYGFIDYFKKKEKGYKGKWVTTIPKFKIL